MRLGKLITLTSVILSFTVNSVSASVLGSVLKDSSSIQMGEGLTLYSNVFQADQSAIGNQSEYYCEYTPNEDVIPVVLTGEEIYGKRNAKEIIQYMKDNEMVPMVGINASFFSLQTGIPMGHVVTDGVITSKDDRTLPGVAFEKDGKAFVDDMFIQTVAYFGEHSLQIPHINKYIFPETQMLTLFTPDFGKTVGTNTETINVVLENLSDKVRIGNEFTATVAEIKTSQEPLEIKDNQYILSVNSKGNQWAIALLNTLEAGQQITVKTTANNEKWNSAYNALASEGERLLKNGEVTQGLPAGTAPRTAVGITADNKVIFYVIDGRQSPISYGAAKTTLAKRLQELGCVEAINLDGGGSTTIAGFYPGSSVEQIINSPSDGALRKVTNFIFLKNVSKPTGTTAKAYIYPYTGTILSGSTIQLSVKTVDENYYITQTGDVTYSSNEYAKIAPNGEMEVLGAGSVEAYADVDGARATAKFNTILTPDSIEIYNEQTGTKLDVIDVLPGDTIYLKAESNYDSKRIMSSDWGYRWSVPEKSGVSVDNNGILVISQDFDTETVLTVKAGDVKAEFPIKPPAGFNQPQSYPTSEVKIVDDTLILDVYTDSGKISKDKTVIKINGERIPLDKCEITGDASVQLSIRYTPVNGFGYGHHKIYCEAVLENGYSSINAYRLTNGEIENIFADTENHWARDIISYMNSKGIVNGSEWDGKIVFRPQDTITRAEFAVMITKYLGVDVSGYQDVSLDIFADRDIIPAWAENYVKAVYALGIISGKSNNEQLYFDPMANITRAETVTVINRLLPDNLLASPISYADNDAIPEWSFKAMKVLSTTGLVGGYTDNTVRPLENMTRAEAVTLLYNIY